MFTEGNRAGWLQGVASHIMDGGDNPPSLSRLCITVPPTILTRESDGHCTAAAAFGEERRKDKEAGWQVIVSEMVTLLREQGFVGGSDEGLTWIKPVDGTWRVTLPDGKEPMIFGQRERRMSTDQAIVGERDAIDGSRVGVPSKFESGRMQPMELLVKSARGNVTMQRFELHPLALTIPPMTVHEREMLRTSIERDGVSQAIVIFQKKILDGRNRAYFASQLGKPVTVTVFEGTEEQARRLVLRLNIHRRHLGGVQLAILAEEFYGAQATRQAETAVEQGRIKGNQNRSPSTPISVQTGKPKRGLQRDEIVAAMARADGIDTTKYAIAGIQPLMNAPKTLARARAGEFQTLAAAHVAALSETNQPVPRVLPEVKPKTVNDRLGMVLDNLNKILRDCEIEPGKAMPYQISGRIHQARDLLGKVEQALRDRKIIP